MNFPTLGFVSSSAQRSAIAQLVCSRRDGSSLLCDNSGLHLQVNRTHKTLPLIDLVDSHYLPGWFWGTIKLTAKNGQKFRITGLPKSGAQDLATAIAHNRKAAIQASVAPLADHLAHADREITAFTQKRFYLSAQFSRYLISISNYLQPLFDLELKQGQLPDTVLNQISRVADFRANHQRMREVLNEKFVEEELDRTKSLLDQIEKNPLTPAQRRAVVINEDCNLVVAAAGSGKTSVIVAKVAYLLWRQLRRPDEILMLAFNKHAADEMKERLQERVGSPIEVRTFHALGYAIIKKVEGKPPPLSKVAGDDMARQKLVRRLIELLIQQDKVFERTISDWFQSYFAPYQSEWDFKSQGEYWRYVRDNNIRTLKGEQVKSFEECEIANWMFLHGIQYQYEAPYKHDVSSPTKRQYMPDFYLPDYDIYIEHFGVNKDGNPAPFMDRQAYLDGMQWKRETHAELGTTLVETYSFEKKDGTLLSGLEQKLQHSVGPEFHISPITITEALEHLSQEGRIDEFSKLVATFLGHFKGSQLNVEELTRRASNFSNSERAKAFVSVFTRILSAYRDKLNEEGEIDFEDMIIKATEHVQSGRFSSPFGYILVDEFQDISSGRARLLKALLSQVEYGQLFCVGDDWQAIFRFAGSDIAIMKEFSEEFGVTAQSLLGQTFRSNNKITKAASKFILRNNAQIEKSVEALATTADKSVFIGYPTGKANDDLLSDALKLIESRTNGEQVEVLLLGRYGFCKPKNFSNMRNTFPNLQIDFRTVHGAKGLEADYVIVLDLKDQRLGFPTGMVDDPLLNLVLARPETFPHAEERRLFYVALTRAKHGAFLLADKAKPSAFVLELERDGYDVGFFGARALVSERCPKCKEGQLSIRDGKYGAFIGCSFYPLCDHTEKVCPQCKAGVIRENGEEMACTNPDCEETPTKCPKCQTGWMIEKHRNDGKGSFLSCSRYPECDFTLNSRVESEPAQQPLEPSPNR